jgi:hypothetical protein
MKPNNTEPVPSIYEVLLDCYHAGSMSQRGKTIHPGTVEEWQKQIERICASERQRAYEDCASKGGDGKTVRSYAKSRAETLQTLIEETPSE